MGGSILCVEDDRIAREFLSKIIAINFPSQKVYAAENGKEGLELFQRVQAGIVLTDISMPVMNGIQMAREIHQLDPAVYIIALSAHNSLECPEEECDLLFTRHLAKPFLIQNLCDIIHQCLDQNGPA